MQRRTTARIHRPARALAFAALALLAPLPAAARPDGPFAVDVLVDGRPLDELATRGRTYVEALPGREYAIRLRNRTAGRVAVALSVDGLNVIDARTTSAAEAAKWILGPRQTLTIEGWQTGEATARRFFFTTETRSYGAWLGETQNLGLIAAAFFREVAPEPVPIAQPEVRRRDAGAPRAQAKSEALADDLAATGIGRELDHRVRRVRFEAEASPSAVVELRYEYRDALVELGVLPRPRGGERLERREGARGFDDFRFAPDPFR